MRTLYILLLLSCFVSVNFAQFCSGTTILSECAGEFDDGSGNNDYANNSNCTWLIQVPEDSTILLIFNSFETESCCDELRVYNGPSSNAPLIGEYKGSSIPSVIQSNSNELFLEFTTDGSVTADGWSVSYTCNNISFIELGYADPGFSNLLVADGSILEYEFELQNNGNLDSGPFEVGFYASKDSEIDISDALMFTEAFDNIPATSALTVSGIRDVRDSIPAGTYSKVGFIIDPQNEVDELAEVNNTYQSFEQIHIPYCSELTTITDCQGTIGDGSGSEDVVQETQCSWLLESENNESIYLDFLSVELSSSDVISIYDGEDQNAPLIQEFGGNDDFYPVVSSGSSIFFEFNVSFSGDEGWNAEYSCTDTSISNLIMELSSNANSTGSTVDFDLDIRNNGNSASPATKIYFFGSIDNNFNIVQDFLIDSLEITSIPAFGQIQLSHIIDARGIVPSGEYLPIAVIDAFDSVVELNEEDNLEIFTDRFHIPYCPDTTTILEDCSGILSDGSGSADFTQGSDCSWLIVADSGQYVSLNLIDANLGSSTNRIRFYNGEDNFSQLIAEFTGSTDDEIPSTILSTGENLYVEFVSSVNFAFGSGWNFQYDCIDDIGVNYEFIENFGIVNFFDDEIRYNINLRNFGNGTTPQTKIYFFLSPDQFINTNDFVLDSIIIPPLQPYQFIIVAHDFNPRIQDPSIPGGEYYAGFFIDPLDEVEEINEDDNSYIDNSIFDIPFCLEEPQFIDDCLGGFDDGSGNDDYADNSECSWVFEGPMGSNIRLTFSAFDTESCCDFVRIFDGSSNNAPLLGTYSGSTLPPAIQTTQSNAYLEFDTDGSVTRAGWEIEYECIEFFSDLQFKNGSTQFQVVNNTLNFATIIENDGVLPTDEFQIGFILSEDKVPNIGDFIISTKTLNSLGPGQEVEDESEIDLSDLDVPAGEYFLIVRLDLGEIIEENDETDNDFISTFPIDIISGTEDIFREAEIMIFILNQDLLIKNDIQHYLRRISLIQADGVVLLDQRIENSNSEHKLDVIDYPAGLYFVRVELEDQIVVKKLFIP